MIDWRSVRLQVFARCPAGGRPKKRLQPPLTQTQASSLHMRLASRTLQLMQFTGGGAVELWLDRPSEHQWVAHVQSAMRCPIRIQCAGDLGSRMEGALRSGLRNHDIAILAGSDCPVLQASHLRRVAQMLFDGCDAAFIPAVDGGYVLIGVRHLDRALFSGIPWGTDAVMRLTRQRMRQLNWRWDEVEPLWDVDRPADLDRLCREGISLPSLAGVVTAV